MDNRKYYQELLEKYDFKKLNIKNGELFEIVNKYELYKKSATNWRLKMLYGLVHRISLTIAEIEAKNALK